MAALREHGVPLPEGMPTTPAGAQGFGALVGAAPAPPVEDPAARLRKLQDLRRDGLITEDEYEAQRAKVLEDL